MAGCVFLIHPKNSYDAQKKYKKKLDERVIERQLTDRRNVIDSQLPLLRVRFDELREWW